MPTDHTTTNTTPGDPPDPGLTEAPWFLKPTVDFSQSMSPYPRTPYPLGSAPRSQVGLVFPR